MCSADLDRILLSLSGSAFESFGGGLRELEVRMARGISMAEYQRRVREAQRKQKQAIDDYNRKVRAHNAEVKREVDAHNREVERQRQRFNSAVREYNRKVRAHNAQVEAENRRRRAALQSLANRSTTVRYQVLHTSTVSLNHAYDRLEGHVGEQEADANDDLILNLPAQEAANSAEVMRSLLEEGPVADIDPEALRTSKLSDALRTISEDLDARWGGALFALSPQNPDAARHFCTSAREIFIKILDLRAPDQDVLQTIPNCPTTDKGYPTRRARVQFMLQRRNIDSDELGDFVDADINNVLDLFSVFNSATHGAAGKYELTKLLAIKTRVEGGIRFLSRLAA